MSITLTALQQQRRDTAANWTSANPTLLAGELGFETDTGKAKLGTGSSVWNSLSYLGLIPSNGIYPLSQLLMPLGTAAAPPLTFNGDLNTGIYSPGADQLSITAGGTQQVAVSTTATTFSQHVNLASAKEYRIAGTKVLDATSLGTAVVSSSLTSVGTIATGTWNATTIAVNRGGTGQTSYTDGQLLIGNTTGNTLTKATLTAGTGVTITNGAGSITISASSTASSAGSNLYLTTICI